MNKEEQKQKLIAGGANIGDVNTTADPYTKYYWASYKWKSNRWVRTLHNSLKAANAASGKSGFVRIELNPHNNACAIFDDEEYAKWKKTTWDLLYRSGDIQTDYRGKQVYRVAVYENGSYYIKHTFYLNDKAADVALNYNQNGIIAISYFDRINPKKN